MLFAIPLGANAVKLEVDPASPFVLYALAAVLLYLHIGGGFVGLIAGFFASISKKGGRMHRLSGKVFLPAMFITYLIGAGVAPFLPLGQRPNFVAGILALYLLLSGVAAARRRSFRAGLPETAGLLIALTVVAMGITFMVMGARSETGTVDGSPPEAFVLFVFFGSLAAIGEIRILVARTLTNTSRILRHLWRMCASFFFASGSLFLGQPQVFPDAFNESPWPFVLAFFPLVVALWGIAAVLVVDKRRKASSDAQDLVNSRYRT